jgi:hypothetical protein
MTVVELLTGIEILPLATPSVVTVAAKGIGIDVMISGKADSKSRD